MDQSQGAAEALDLFGKSRLPRSLLRTTTRTAHEAVDDLQAC